MDKLVLSVVLLLAASASVKSQYQYYRCSPNQAFCVYDSDCCTKYCEYMLGEDGYGRCTDWPFPNCGRDGDDCLHHSDCCHGFCAHEQNKYASFNYCTNGPVPSFAPLPSSPLPSPVPEPIEFSPPSPPAPQISPSFGIAPGPLADSGVPSISPPVASTTTTPPTSAPCHHGKMKKHRSRKGKHPKAPRAPTPGREF